MVMNANWICCDPFTIYRSIKLVCRILEINIILYVNHTSLENNNNESGMLPRIQSVTWNRDYEDITADF